MPAGLRAIPLLLLLVALHAGAEETPTALDATVVSGARGATPAITPVAPTATP